MGDRKGWSKCNPGYYMKGLYRTNGLFRAGLHNIETAKCCKPTNQRSAWGSCYQANVLHSFDRKGWSKCSPGYYMAGMWRNDCDNLYCIEISTVVRWERMQKKTVFLRNNFPKD